MNATYTQSSVMAYYELKKIYTPESLFCFFHAKSLFHLDFSVFFSSRELRNLNVFLFLD